MSARPGLCGGYQVTGIPTAISLKPLQGFVSLPPPTAWAHAHLPGNIPVVGGPAVLAIRFLCPSRLRDVAPAVREPSPCSSLRCV